MTRIRRLAAVSAPLRARLAWLFVIAVPILVAACNNKSGGGPGY